ncbi:hypothetical protein DM01DRAFT_1026388 [Hesseltinella vesiculosa]|uniref:Uncharacterized protein n=1 Tax=Hesseltinella vesiculosa TaxID=101127 RepID=A0A1X2GKG6_9FUNG|nr:hypothetical protein DM01DRAFT_1026388 [Hesseltinella vesiculosa]
MDPRKTNAKLDITVENDCLIMFGSAMESRGCILRGVVRLSLAQSIKVKSLFIRFSGKSLVTYCDGKPLFFFTSAVSGLLLFF